MLYPVELNINCQLQILQSALIALLVGNHGFVDVHTFLLNGERWKLCYEVTFVKT